MAGNAPSLTHANRHASGGPDALSPAAIGADVSGAAASAQSYSIQRTNHTGTQTASTVSDFATAVAAVIAAAEGIANGIATLDSTGKLTAAQIPAIALTNTTVVSSQAAMLALTAQPGDIAVRSDLSETFVLASSPATTLGNWILMQFPTSTVTSFAGRTGAITATSADLTDFATAVDARIMSKLQALQVLIAVRESGSTYTRPAYTGPAVFIGADQPGTGGSTSGGSATVDDLDAYWELA